MLTYTIDSVASKRRESVLDFFVLVFVAFVIMGIAGALFATAEVIL